MNKNIASAIAIFILGLGLRLGRINYLSALGITPLQASSQAIEYVLLGKGLLQSGGWSANYFVARPPLMPLLIAAVYATTGEAPLLVAIINCLLGAATATIAFFYARQLLNDSRIAFVTGILVAIDPASISQNMTLQAETLTNFLLVLGTWQLAAALQSHRWRGFSLAGLLLGMAALARPTTVFFYLLCLPLLVLLVKKWARMFLALAVLPTIMLLAWCARNYYFFGEFTYSTASDFNLLFYRAVSVERLATKKNPDLIRREFALEIEHRLGNTFTLDEVDSGYYWNNFAPADSRRVRLMRDLALQVYWAHPIEYFATLPIGLYRMYAFSAAYGSPYLPELVFNLGLYALAVLGAYHAWRKQQRLTWALNGLLICYVTLATLISQTSGMDTRMRTSITFALAILAAVGSTWLWDVFRQSNKSRRLFNSRTNAKEHYLN